MDCSVLHLLQCNELSGNGLFWDNLRNLTCPNEMEKGVFIIQEPNYPLKAECGPRRLDDPCVCWAVGWGVGGQGVHLSLCSPQTPAPLSDQLLLLCLLTLVIVKVIVILFLLLNLCFCILVPFSFAYLFCSFVTGPHFGLLWNSSEECHASSAIIARYRVFVSIK